MAEYNHSITLIMLLFVLMIKIGSGHDECDESSCGDDDIRFPFQLHKGSPNDGSCAHPEFCLYCTKHKKTTIVLPTTTSGPIEFLVNFIDYTSQDIYLSDPENCIANKFLKLNDTSFHPYVSEGRAQSKFSFFNCSSIGYRHLRVYSSSQDMISCPIYMSGSHTSVLDMDLASCTKMFDRNSSYYSVLESSLPDAVISLSWSNPNCSECKAKGKKCRWKNNITYGDIECFECKHKRKRKTIQVPKSFLFAAAGTVLLGLMVIVFLKTYLHYKKKEEDEARVDKFLEDYRAQKPTRFSYSDIKRITSGFKEKLGEGAHGMVFKGKLSNEILVAVKMLNYTTGGEGKDFINEVEIMGKIHHINVVRLLGFCADGIHRALVYNLFTNGSLQDFLFPFDDKDHFLGWEKLQQIALGIAKGIEYLHHGCTHPILHFDINPHNVLLDDHFTPKISDFGLAKLCSKSLSVVSMTSARGTLGFMAPEVFSRNFGNVSFKSDIYSYGMLLLEMVGRRKNIDTSSPETFQVLYPEWIHNLLEGDIHIHIDCEGDVKIAKKLAIVGLWCIQWQPMNRPSIKAVIQMLGTEDENRLNVPPNPFHSTNSITTRERTFMAQPFQMEVIQE